MNNTLYCPRPFSFIFPIDDYNLVKAQARVTIDLGNRGKVISIEMNPDCFAAVTNRHSLVMEIEEHADKIFHGMYMRGELLEQNEIDYRREIATL